MKVSCNGVATAGIFNRHENVSPCSLLKEHSRTCYVFPCVSVHCLGSGIFVIHLLISLL